MWVTYIYNEQMYIFFLNKYETDKLSFAISEKNVWAWDPSYQHYGKNIYAFPPSGSTYKKLKH